MRKKRTLLALLSAAFLLFAACGALVYWFAATPAGARWLGAAFVQGLGVEAKARRVEGNLLHGLTLTDLSLSLPDIEVRIKSVQTRWQPLTLLAGKIAVTSLLVRGVEIKDNRPDTGRPPDLTWPRAPAFLASLRGSVAVLDAGEITYARLKETPVAARRLACRIDWSGARLTARDLVIEMPAVTLVGEMAAGFLTPALAARLTATLHPVQAEIKSVLLTLDSRRARAPEQLTDDLSLVVVSGTDRRLTLRGEAGLTRSSLALRKLELTQSERKGTVTGEGEILFPRGSPFLNLRARVANLDLAEEVSIATDISGTFSVTGAPENYAGKFALANKGKGLRQATLAGAFAGERDRLKLASLTGAWLGGKVGGKAELSWGEKSVLAAELQARGLQPALISPDWTGEINLNLKGGLQWSGSLPPEGYISGLMLTSRLHGQALAGQVEARLHGGDLVLAGLDLKGKGFDIHAAGPLKEQITYRAAITDLGSLIPRARGRLSAGGWVSFRDGRIAFTATGEGRALGAAGVDLERLNFDIRLGLGEARLLNATVDAMGVHYGSAKLVSARLSAQGPLAGHTLAVALRSSRGGMDASLAGAYRSGAWQGTINKLSGGDGAGPWSLLAPADLRVSRGGFSLSPLTLEGAPSERIVISGRAVGKALQGEMTVRWKGLDLRRVSEWLTQTTLTGTSSGALDARWVAGNLDLLTGSLDARGTVGAGAGTITVRRAAAKITGGRQGLLATGGVELAGGGSLEGRYVSQAAGVAAWESGDLELQWREIDPALIPGLPAGVTLQGRLSGGVKGRILPGRLLDVSGTTSLENGVLGWQRGKNRSRAEVRSALMSFAWRNATLGGGIDLSLREYGQARVTFQLPLPAQLPPSLDRTGRLAVTVSGRLQETGLLTSLFPGLVQESEGEMNVDFQVGGTWEKPQLGGSAEVTRAGAYLPTAGIRLQEATLKARLEGEQVVIDSFQVASGPGRVELKAVITLSDWRPSSYAGTLKGSRFQSVYLPELRVLVSPDLTFNGTDKTLTVRGGIAVPELIALGSEKPVVAPSGDVVIVDAPQKQEPRLPFALDLRLRVALGEKVTVKAEGADVRLGGNLDLTADSLENVRARGVITIVEGKYSAYGVNLDITRGRLIFAGPAASPTLDVLAVHKVEDTTVGVLVSGTLSAPVLKLYSNPPMADSDIMAFLVLGRSLGSDIEDIPLVGKIAGILLPRGLATSIQSQLQSRFGFSSLGLQLGTSVGPAGATGAGPTGTGTAGSAPAGQVTAEAQGALARSVVTVGTYLTPKLYFRVGRSLFTDANLLQLRYKFSPHWELETESGTVSGADIFYKLEFK